MKAVGPYNPEIGKADPTMPWQNERAELGYEGSIPSAEFPIAVNTELVNLIQGAGLTPSDTDLTQVLQAVTAVHRISDNVTFQVPGDFDTLPAALTWLSTKAIATNKTVTVQLGAGDFQVDVSTGPLFLDHPNGDRIVIQGQPLTSTGFPLANELDNANKTTVEALLRTRFPTVVKVVGPTMALFMKSGSLKLLKNVLFVGDASTQQDGLLVGQFQGELGTGNIALENVFFFNLGRDGCRSNYNSAIQGKNIGASHCGGQGFLAANESAIQAQGSWLAVRNIGPGLQIRDQSFAELFNGSGAFIRNGGPGILSNETGSWQAMAAIALQIANNGGPGLSCQYGSYAAVPALTTGGGNSGSDVVTSAGATTHVQTGHALTLSPAANTVGNNNAINVVS